MRGGVFGVLDKLFCIGDGSKVNVMRGPWLRNNPVKWLPSPQNPATAEVIIGVPIFQEVTEDKLIWEDDRDGLCSVKAGYKFIMREFRPGAQLDTDVNWSAVWRIHAPPKAKHVSWRICKGCIPTLVRLLQWHVDCSRLCPLCTAEPEDELHSFFTCSSIGDSWTAAGLGASVYHRLHNAVSAAGLLSDICSNEDSNLAGRIAMHLWCLWQNRNDKMWNDHMLSPAQIGQQSFGGWQAWLEAQQMRQQQSNAAVVPPRLRWVRPLEGWLKCNVDAGFYLSDSITTEACCFCDSEGQFILAQTSWKNAKLSVIEGEGVALLEAIKLAIHKGYNHVVFESDSQSLVNSIYDNSVGISEFSSVIINITQLLDVSPNFKVKFIKRQANLFAHTLARAANFWPSLRIFDISPLCIEFILINEMS